MSIKKEHATISVIPEDLTAAKDAFIRKWRARKKSVNTLRVYGFDVGKFVEYSRGLGTTKVLEVSPEVIDDFLIELQDSGHNTGGVHGYYRCIKVFFNWYWDYFEPNADNPIKSVQIDPPKSKAKIGLAPSAVQRLVEACTTHHAIRDRAILLYLFDTGVRANEFLQTNMGDIDLDREQVSILSGKGGTSRIVYFGNSTEKALRKYLKSRDDLKPRDPLFINEDGNRFMFSGLRQIIRRRSEAAGLPMPGMHDFRRGFAQELQRQKVPLKIISYLLGHTNITTTMRYLGIQDSEIEEAYKVASPVDNWRL